MKEERVMGKQGQQKSISSFFVPPNEAGTKSSSPSSSSPSSPHDAGDGKAGGDEAPEAAGGGKGRPRRLSPSSSSSSWKATCEKILAHMRQLDEDEWFSAPVDPIQLGIEDYFDIIKEPLAMSTIQDKLKDGQYTKPDDFAKDMRLVFSNAMRYNESPEHIVHDTAKNLAKTFNQQWNVHFPSSSSSESSKEASSTTNSKDERGMEKKSSAAEGPKSKKRTATATVHPFFAKRVLAAEDLTSPQAPAAVSTPQEPPRSHQSTKPSTELIDLSDDSQLRTCNTFFLNKEQRKRKAELEHAAAEEEARTRRREEIDRINSGREVHRFFMERAKASSSSKGDGEDASKEWPMAMFPSIGHVTQEEGSFAQTSIKEVSDKGPLLSMTEAGNQLLCYDGCGEGQEARGVVHLIDVEADEAVREVMMWKENRGNADSLPDASMPEPWSGGTQEAIQELAAVARISQESVDKQMRWIQAQHDRGETSNIAQWIDKYRPHEPGVLLWDLRKVAKEVQRWLKEWEEWRKSGHKNQSKRSGAAKRRRKCVDEEDDFDSEEDEEEAEPKSTTLITGPPGCGKSTLIYALAQKLGFEVIEVNTTQLRSGAEVKKLFSEATQSQHIGGGSASAASPARPKVQQNTPFQQFDRSKKGKGKGRKKVEDEEVILDVQAAGKPSSSSQRMTLILIEEVDLVFEEDKGFHNALKELMSSAKWPMILTSNQPPRALRDIPFHIRHVEPCSAPQVAVLLSMIWAAEELPANPPSAFSVLASAYPGDVRSPILNLQLLACKPSALMLTTDQQHQSVALPISPPAASTLGIAQEMFGYHYPIVKSIRPFCGRMKGGTKITIYGSHFLQHSAGISSMVEEQDTWAPVEVLIGWKPCTDVNVVSDEVIEARVPPSPLATPSQYPVVVRLCHLVSSTAIRQQGYQAVFAYQKKQACVAAYFPDVRVAGSRKRLVRPVAAAAAADNDDDKKGVEEEEDLGIDEASKDQHEVAVEAEESLLEGEEKVAQKEQERSSKRRKVVVESDDEGDEWVEPSVEPSGRYETGDEEGHGGEMEEEQQVQEEGGPLEDKPDQEGNYDKNQGEGGEEEAAAADDIPSLPIVERTYSQLFKAPEAEGQQVEQSVLDGLTSFTESRSCYNGLLSFAPQLDGDDYLQYPCSSFLRFIRAGLQSEDDETSPWPSVPDVGGAVGQVLETLVEKHRQEASADREYPPLQVTYEPTRELHRALAMDVVLPLLPSKFNLPSACRADIHLDYAATLRAMQVTEDLENAAVLGNNGSSSPQLRRGRSRRRPKSYIATTLGLEEDLRASLRALTSTAMTA